MTTSSAARAQEAFDECHKDRKSQQSPMEQLGDLSTSETLPIQTLDTDRGLRCWLHSEHVAVTPDSKSTFAPLQVTESDFMELSKSIASPTDVAQCIPSSISGTALKSACGFELSLVFCEVVELSSKSNATDDQGFSALEMIALTCWQEKEVAAQSDEVLNSSDDVPFCEDAEGSASRDADSSSSPKLVEYWVLVYESAQRDLLLKSFIASGVVWKDITECCTVDQMIGSGSFSQVFSGRFDGKQVAIKRLGPQNQRDKVKREISMVMACNGCPHFTHLRGVFRDCESHFGVSLVLDRAMGGDLISYVEAVGKVGEGPALQVMDGIMAALQFIHTLPVPIVHRDIKAENVLLTVLRESKLTDMGIAAFETDEKEMCARVGSPGYAAPEVIRTDGKKYGTKVDLFGAGVISYFIIAGKLPFAGRDVPSVLRRTLRCKVDFNETTWRKQSFGMQCLTKSLLRFSPDDRPNAELALRAIKRIQAEMSRSNDFEERRTWSATPAAHEKFRTRTNCLDVAQLELDVYQCEQEDSGRSRSIQDQQSAKQQFDQQLASNASASQLGSTTSSSTVAPVSDSATSPDFCYNVIGSPQLCPKKSKAFRTILEDPPKVDEIFTDLIVNSAVSASETSIRYSWAPASTSERTPICKHRAIHRPSHGNFEYFRRSFEGFRKSADGQTRKSASNFRWWKFRRQAAEMQELEQSEGPILFAEGAKAKFFEIEPSTPPPPTSRRYRSRSSK